MVVSDYYIVPGILVWSARDEDLSPSLVMMMIDDEWTGTRSRLLVSLTVSLGLFWLLKAIYHYLNVKIASWSAHRKYGCLAPPSYPHTDWTGRDLVESRQAAATNGRQMAHYDGDNNDAGSNTLDPAWTRPRRFTRVFQHEIDAHVT